MKNTPFKKHTLSILTIFAAAVLLVSCSKNNDNNSKPSGKSHQLVFKAVASAGSNIDQAVYGYDSNQTSATSLSGTTWSSPAITVPAGTVEAVCDVTAFGTNASSTLQVQIYVDGTLVKTGTASGATLVGSVAYSF